MLHYPDFTLDCWEESEKFEGISQRENSCCHQVGHFAVLGLFPQHVSMENFWPKLWSGGVVSLQDYTVTSKKSAFIRKEQIYD